MTTKKLGSSIDPRIDSPEIKVIYPSTVDLSKEPETTGGVKAPQPQVLPQSPAIVSSPPLVPPPLVTVEETPVAVATKKWTDILKENATLFITVALISILTGILIGKKL